ncbi:MAG: CheR family methyltransferase [Planctomycetaceae bacterium]
MLHQIADVEDYARRLRQDGGELNSLYHDLLIGVTRFFRDPELFETLQDKVIPEVVERAGADGEIRVWVPGCATGEEAYSIAILLHEHFTALSRPLSFKIFGTDVHIASLDAASEGEYDRDAVAGVSQGRLDRYFERQGDKYRVVPELRNSIVFARHNLLKDAPFTKLDMISCRNLLIYFQPPAQKKALSLCQFGLKTNGILVLGPSESPGELQSEFDVIDGHWRVYRKRRDTRLPADLRFPLPNNRIALPRSENRTQIALQGSRTVVHADLLRAYDWILSKFVPTGILVDDRHEVQHIFGDSASLLKFKSGRPSTDVLELFDGNLRMAVTSALHRVKKDGIAVRYDGVQVNGQAQDTCCLSVEQVHNPKAHRQQYLISLRPTCAEQLQSSERSVVVNTQSMSQERIDALENDLRFAQENLQATVEELETANEEMQAANEELVASNEELQSTNEELHSVNEELYTVNAEYQKKIYELTEMTADLDTLMECTDVATVFLDPDLRIRKFTPQIVPIFKLLSQDVGRCIDTFAHHLKRDNLVAAIKLVLRSGERLEEEIQTDQGRWLHMRVLPYRSEKVIKGVVLTLIDIDTLKRAEQSLAQSLREREGFIAVLSHELRNPVNAIVSASRLLSQPRSNAADMQDVVAVIERQSKHIARLLEDLLDVSRMTQNKLCLRMEAFDLRSAIAAAIETTQPVFAQHRQTLNANICPDPLIVQGDEHRLNQVVANLLVNAAKYSPEFAVIELSATRAGTEAVLRITDNGQGIPAESMKYIFTAFTQSSQDWHHHDGGMGIGLCLAKSIVERHQGCIDVHSDGEGRGSQFTVQLPLAPGRSSFRNCQWTKRGRPNCFIRLLPLHQRQL